MGIQKQKSKQVVWQDIKPVRTPIKAVAKKPLWSRIKHVLSVPFRLQIFPKINKLFTKINRKIQIAFALFIIVIAASGVYYFTSTNKTVAQKTNDNQDSSYTVTDLKKGTPDYSTVAPTGKDIDSLGGWTRISPPNSDPVYAYADKIGKVSISVSEQPLPDNLKEDTANGIAQLARSFNANEKITIGKTTVYIGTSGDGPQSVIFTKNSLLVLIKSSDKIKSDLWATYINSMQ
jgi:hypothetical protein